jgi:hypothetical protein
MQGHKAANYASVTQLNSLYPMPHVQPPGMPSRGLPRWRAGSPVLTGKVRPTLRLLRGV